ncbi:MAG TPA: MgtC/SapB family protein [Gemmatimonadota bacterium]|nr:MgtC/SapB family protein [Gemmatimonadota bacterium]
MSPLVRGLELPVLGRLLLAVALGAAIGLERELSGKPAGLRTNILICVGAELFTELSVAVATGFLVHDLMRGDPGRIASHIVEGIGFIGAGTILVAGGNVLGLTTAATLWVVAAIGMGVGLHLYVQAVGAAVLVVIVLWVLGRFERRVLPDKAEHVLRVRAVPEIGLEGLRAALAASGLQFEVTGHEHDEEGSAFYFLLRGTAEERDALLRRLAGMEGVASARYV